MRKTIAKRLGRESKFTVHYLGLDLIWDNAIAARVAINNLLLSYHKLVLNDTS
jgi:hypothetical protein